MSHLPDYQQKAKAHLNFDSLGGSDPRWRMKSSSKYQIEISDSSPDDADQEDHSPSLALIAKGDFNEDGIIDLVIELTGPGIYRGTIRNSTRLPPTLSRGDDESLCGLAG